MRIGWVSAAPYAHTGYGIMARNIGSRLLQRHKVVCIGGIGGMTVWGGKMELTTKYGNLLVLPTLGDVSGSNVTQWYINKYKLDLIISHWDSFTIEWTGGLTVPAINYIPIDAPFTSRMAHYVRNAFKVVAFCKYGYKELLKFFPPNRTSCIEHGIDTSVYKPRSDTRDEIREKLNIPKGAFVFIDVGANIGERKQIPLLMLVFKEILKRYKNCYLYLYTNIDEPYPRGYSLSEFGRMLGISDNLRYPDFNPILEPLEDEEMAKLYSMADVYATPTLGEGYGMPVQEAMSCGLPVIATRCSSLIELVQGHGWLVDTVKDFVFIPVWIPTLQMYPAPSMPDLLSKMEEAYNSPSKVAEYGKKSREFALRNDWNKIMPKWFKLLDEAEEEIELFKSFWVR